LTTYLSLCLASFFSLTDTAPPEIYTLSLHDALPISTEFFAKTGQIPVVCIRLRGVVFFLESGQGRLVVAREPQRTIRHDPLCVEHVRYDLAYRPFFSLVTVQALFFSEQCRLVKTLF